MGADVLNALAFGVEVMHVVMDGESVGARREMESEEDVEGVEMQVVEGR